MGRKKRGDNTNGEELLLLVKRAGNKVSECEQEMLWEREE